MKKMWFALLPVTAALLLSSCGQERDEQEVISQRYIHKYGYAVSEAEWRNNNYPGQVVTTLRNGVTITSTYENGVLNGPSTHTHPHSQTVQHYYLYNFGDLKEEVRYDSLAMPIEKKVQLSPARFAVTKWYGDGTPMSTEDFTHEELIEGEYYSLNNEVESRVERGNGIRTRRNQNGVLLSKDTFDAGYLTQREAFYPNGNLESITNFNMNKRHGERLVFIETGDPLAEEEWFNDQLHGKCSYFSNGKKQTVVYFLNGARNGLETHYIDGEAVEQEILWSNDKRHGATKFYVADEIAKTEWYYDGRLVGKNRYDELDQLDQMLSQAATEYNDNMR